MIDATDTFKVLSCVKVSHGNLIRFSTLSEYTHTLMTCAIYLPITSTSSSSSCKLPVLFYLSGLTCTDENVCQKGNAFKSLHENSMAFVCPDTSPRGAGIDGESDSWDFGVGAGFYIDATEMPWSKNYNMYSYITKELPMIIEKNFNDHVDITRMSITGHSMGGHGALSIAIKNPGMFKSVSAFAPICNPINCPWGLKAFTNYLGSDRETWKECDSVELILKYGKVYDDILIDVGTSDTFYKNSQLLPENFVTACQSVNQSVTLRMQEGYDHSYYFISTFIDDHIQFHAKRLHL